MPVLEDRLSATLFPAAEIPETAPEVAVGSGKPLRNGKRFVTAPSRDQLTFSARCTEDLVPLDAPVRVYDEIMELLKEALEENGQKRVSETDPEALQQKVNDVCRPGYNGQLAVDDKAGFAVAQTVTTDQNDQQQFVPMAREVERNVDALPDACVGDSGYHSPETLEALEAAPPLKDCSHSFCCEGPREPRSSSACAVSA